jgi:hypothetical protein
MNENADWVLQANEAEVLADESISAQLTVTLNLPPALAQLLQQHSGQVGQTQAEAIVSLLESALGSMPVSVPQSSLSLESEHQSTAQELEMLKARLSQLESFIPRLEVLEGKSIAF